MKKTMTSRLMSSLMGSMIAMKPTDGEASQNSGAPASDTPTTGNIEASNSTETVNEASTDEAASAEAPESGDGEPEAEPEAENA